LQEDGKEEEEVAGAPIGTRVKGHAAGDMGNECECNATETAK